ncbi:MAG: AI-2E family transporter [Archangium sp.]
MLSPGDRIATFFAEKTARRALALSLFAALLVGFRHLALMLVFFVTFERGLFFTAGFLSRRFKWKRVWSLLAVLAVAALLLGIGGFVSAGRLKKLMVDTRDTLPQRMAALREHPWYATLQEHLPDSEDLAASAEHYAADVARSAAAIGRGFLMALIGLILAIVYFLDEERIRAFRNSLEPGTLFGTLVRWGEHLAESVSLTVQVQLVVAACNAVLTLPVLLLIGVPRVAALMVLIFVAGLIPVVGNLISGAVLVILAYQVKGWLGVALFVGLTFVLHKIESYYLNPRLTARHVALPGFVLILSLIAWEHLLGFAGLFVSFPFLFLAGKIRSEFQGEDLPTTVPGTPPAEATSTSTAPA